MTKLKAFADDKLNVAGMEISLYDRVENTVGNGENAGYQPFLLFPVFSNAFFFRIVESQLNYPREPRWPRIAQMTNNKCQLSFPQTETCVCYIDKSL